MQPAAPGHVAQAARGRRVWGKTGPQRPALLVFGDGKAPCLAAPVPCRAGGCGPGNDKNGRKRKARAQEEPYPAAGCARLGRGNLPPAEPEKNGPSAARAPGFSRWESALFGCAGARRAGGCGPGNDKMAANEKRGRRRGPSHSRMCAAWPRQLAAQTAASKGRGFFFHGRKFGRGVESLFHF